MLCAGIPAVLSLGVLLFIGFPSDLWTPNGAGDLLRDFICAILFGAAGIFVHGARPLIEDREVRKHSSQEVTIIEALGRVHPSTILAFIDWEFFIGIRFMYHSHLHFLLTEGGEDQKGHFHKL